LQGGRGRKLDDCETGNLAPLHSLSRKRHPFQSTEEEYVMRKPLLIAGVFVVGAMVGALLLPRSLTAQQEGRAALVIVERLATTADESVQDEYAKRAREILPKYGARYLARSRQNLLLEGDGEVPCCVAILQFPSMDAARRWYDSSENQEASRIRQSGGKFRLVAIEGLAPQN
jgi:uncharacterized protein (DUF1330 family)